ncbi:MAG: hypothetical protein V1769_01120 [Thermoplasmatota archaeon]
MPSVIGFDSKEIHREINGEDRMFPLGAIIEIVNYEQFASIVKQVETIKDQQKHSKERIDNILML